MLNRVTLLRRLECQRLVDELQPLGQLLVVRLALACADQLHARSVQIARVEQTVGFQTEAFAVGRARERLQCPDHPRGRYRRRFGGIEPKATAGEPTVVAAAV
jgi:hypothetical protein